MIDHPDNQLAAARIEREKWRAMEAERRLAELRSSHLAVADIDEAFGLVREIARAELRIWAAEAEHALEGIKDPAEAEALLNQTGRTTLQRIANRIAATRADLPS